MTPEQITTIITGVFEGGGVLTFVYFVIRGLKKNIKSLNSTIEVQSKTLDVMEKRIDETKNIGDIYKDLLKEIPDDLKQYKKFIRESKDALITDLKKSIKENNKKHKKEAEDSLVKIHEQEKIINDLIKARNSLISANNVINDGLESISNYYLSNHLENKMANLNTIKVFIEHKGELNIFTKEIGEMKLIPIIVDENCGDNEIIVNKSRV